MEYFRLRNHSVVCLLLISILIYDIFALWVLFGYRRLTFDLYEQLYIVLNYIHTKYLLLMDHSVVHISFYFNLRHSSSIRCNMFLSRIKLMWNYCETVYAREVDEISVNYLYKFQVIFYMEDISTSRCLEINIPIITITRKLYTLCVSLESTTLHYVTRSLFSKFINRLTAMSRSYNFYKLAANIGIPCPAK